MREFYLSPQELEVQIKSFANSFPSSSDSEAGKVYADTIREHLKSKKKLLQNAYPDAYKDYINGFLLGISNSFRIIDIYDSIESSHFRRCVMDEEVNPMGYNGFLDSVGIFLAIATKSRQDLNTITQNLHSLRELALGK